MLYYYHRPLYTLSEVSSASKTGPLHLLLTDVVMPGMRGNLLAERLVNLLPNLKVLFMSGYVGGALDVQDLLGTRAAFLQKPFSPDLLAYKLREVLDS